MIERHLGATLQAIHLVGSALDVGLKPHSDIDSLATIAVRPGESMRRATVAQRDAEPDWRGDECSIVLALARIRYSAATGRIAPKDVAATWVLARLPDAHRLVVAAARAAYLDGEAGAGDAVGRAARRIHRLRAVRGRVDVVGVATGADEACERLTAGLPRMANAFAPAACANRRAGYVQATIRCGVTQA